MAGFYITPAPYNVNAAMGSASAEITVPGFTELGTGTGSAFVLSDPPYEGALVTVVMTGSATAGKTIITDATGVSLNPQLDRTVTLAGEGNSIQLLGISTTRWQIVGGWNYTTA